METPHDQTRSFSPIDGVIADYIRAVEAGQNPDRSELFDKYPDLSALLRLFFEDFDRVDRAIAPLRLGDGTESAANPPGLVRYFGDYELLEEVARGGMGVVYRARQTPLNRFVALKMVLAGDHASSREVQRFRIEAEAAANLDHPNIVPIFEVGEHEGLQYLSMKFIDGHPLGRRPRGSFREEVAGMLAVARAVHHAHQHGVLHRDLKPSNILVDQRGDRLVSDFGLAKRLADVDGSLTESGDILGTPRYMAPEQAAGRRDLTVSADIYSLGAILYERLTGRAPFLAENVVTLLHQVRESEPSRPSTLVPGLDRDLETIVLKCLDKDPSRRYATAEAMAADLENWLAGRPILARPLGRVSRAWRWCRRNRAVAALMATVAASLVAGTAVSIVLALRAEAHALDAGLAATRARVLLARSGYESITDEINDEPELRAPDDAFLALAQAYALAPAHHSADDLRRCILAGLAIEAQRRRPLIGIRGASDQPATVAVLSVDGRRWAEAAPDGTVRVWEIPGGRLLTTLHRHPGGVSGLAFSPDGRLLATQSRDNGSWGHLGPISIVNKRSIHPVGMGTWGFDLLYNDFGRGDNMVRVWDLAGGALLASLPHDSPPDFIEFGLDGEHIYTSEMSPKSSPLVTPTASDPPGRVMNSWRIVGDNTSGPDQSKTLGPHRRLGFPSVSEHVSNSLHQSPDGKTIAIRAANDSLFRVYDARNGRHLHDIPGSELAWDPTGREVATLEWTSTDKNKDGGVYRLRCWDANSGKAASFEGRCVLPAMRWWFVGLDYSPDGRALTVHWQYGNRDQPEVHVFSRRTGERLAQLPSPIAGYSPDRSLAALYNGNVHETTNWLRLRPQEGRRFHARLNETAKMGLFVGDDGIWDVATDLAVESISQRAVFPKPCEIPEGLIWRDSGMPRFLPREPFAADPQTLMLWAEVLVRRRIVGEFESEPLAEGEWDERRQDLLRRLPPSASPLLATLANDPAHWRREEARGALPIENNQSQFLKALDRLIEIEPAWSYRHTRGVAYAKIGNWSDAAREFLAAAREAGDWYWESPPAILDPGELNRLLIDDDPERILRETPDRESDVIEVAMHYLAFLRRDDSRLCEAVADAMSRPDPPAGSVERALEITGRLTRDGEGTLADREAHGMTLLRAGRFVESLRVLEGAFQDSPEDYFGPYRRVRLKLLLAMAHAHMGHIQEARAWLRETGDVDEMGGRLLEEARSVILDVSFPVDPFAH